MQQSTPTKKTLKSKNLPWLCSVAVADGLVFVLTSLPSSYLPDGGLIWVRLLPGGTLPIAVLLLTSLLSSGVKEILVFWRLKDVLPGHRAFSKYALKDSRINLDALKKRIGVLPVSPREQNAKWYSLYKNVSTEEGVNQAHQHFLLFRDLATLSLMLILLVLALSLISEIRTLELSFTILFLSGQYFLTAIAARNNGIRLVTNVLALYAAEGLPAEESPSLIHRI